MNTSEHDALYRPGGRVERKEQDRLDRRFQKHKSMTLDEAEEDSWNYLSSLRKVWEDGIFVRNEVTAMTWEDVLSFDASMAARAADWAANPVVVVKKENHVLVTRGNEHLLFTHGDHKNDDNEETDWAVSFVTPRLEEWDTDSVADCLQFMWEEVVYGRNTGIIIGGNTYIRICPYMVRLVATEFKSLSTD